MPIHSALWAWDNLRACHKGIHWERQGTAQLQRQHAEQKASPVVAAARWVSGGSTASLSSRGGNNGAEGGWVYIHEIMLPRPAPLQPLRQRLHRGRLWGACPPPLLLLGWRRLRYAASAAGAARRCRADGLCIAVQLAADAGLDDGQLIPQPSHL